MYSCVQNSVSSLARAFINWTSHKLDFTRLTSHSWVCGKFGHLFPCLWCHYWCLHDRMTKDMTCIHEKLAWMWQKSVLEVFYEMWNSYHCLATFELFQFDHCNGQMWISNHGKLKIIWLHLNYNKINLGLNLLYNVCPIFKRKHMETVGL